MGSTGVTLVELGVSVAAAALLVADAMLRRRGQAHRLHRARSAALVALGIVGALGWWSYFQLGARGFVQGADHYHYYLGAKYFPELGYTRLYRCTVLAETQMQPRLPQQGRRIRDLETNRLVPVERALSEPERCTAHFSPERWGEFVQDVAWFRSRIAPAAWRQLTLDHGFNAPPVWGVLGVAVANAWGVGDDAITWASRIDPLLQLLLWTAVGWAFGWRVLCVGLVFWGTNGLGEFRFLGGGYLRQDWLCAAVVGLCALRRGHYAWAGALLATSALLRLFPVFLIAALGLRALVSMGRARSWWPRREHLRFAAGAVLAAAVLVPLSMATGGWDVWPRFARNIELHRETPLLNHVGLLTLASWDAANPPPRDASHREEVRWAEARRETQSEHWVWILAVASLYAALLLRAAARAPDWAMACLGVGAVFVFAEVTAYYYALLVAFALLHERDPAAGPAVCAFSALSLALASDAAGLGPGAFHAALSALLLPLVLGLTWRAGNPPAEHVEG